MRSRVRKIYVVLSTSKEDNIVWKEMGRTEEGLGGKDFRWVRSCIVEYHPEDISLVKAKLCATGKRGAVDSLSYVTCTLPQIVLARGRKLVLPLKSKERHLGGELVIRAEEVRDRDSCGVDFTVEATSLRKGKFPYFEISRELQDGAGWFPILRSESHRGYHAGRCTFKRTITTSTVLTNSNNNRRLKIEFFDSKAGLGKDYVGGHCIFTVNDVLRAKRAGERFELHLTKVKGRNQQEIPAGTCAILNFEMEDDVSFQDVMDAGCVMNTMIAVDFSSTNGSPRDPNCPHYINMYGPNEYENVLKEIGCLLASYDTFGSFASWGFAARLGSDPSSVSHCFALNGNDVDPSCKGIDGVLSAYKRKLCDVTPDKPCMLGPVLECALEYCRQIDASATEGLGLDKNMYENSKATSGNVYSVLMILTDGDFDDFEIVQEILDEAASLSVSIVLVSVGNAECSKLYKLDSTNAQRVDRKGIRPGRKVQYIPFRKYRKDPAKLASEVFREIPSHVAESMKGKKAQHSGAPRKHASLNAVGSANADVRASKFVRPMSTPALRETPFATYGSVSASAELESMDSQRSSQLQRRSAIRQPSLADSRDVESMTSIEEVPISFARPLFPLPLQSSFQRPSHIDEKMSQTPDRRPFDEPEREDEVEMLETDVEIQHENEDLDKQYYPRYRQRLSQGSGKGFEILHSGYSRRKRPEPKEERRRRGAFEGYGGDGRAPLASHRDPAGVQDTQLHPDHMRCAQQQIRHSVSSPGQGLSAFPTAPPPPSVPTAAYLRPRSRRLQENVGW